MKRISALCVAESLLVFSCLAATSLHAAPPAFADVQGASHPTSVVHDGEYLLGPQDSLVVRITDESDIPPGPYAIDLQGNLALPELGVIHAAGMTISQLAAEITKRSKVILQNPIVSVSVAEYHSQRVSIFGAVTTPGVHQIQGRMTLFEVISDAGGLRQDAGDVIDITRQSKWGTIPLPNAKADASGKYSVAELSVQAVMNARDPQENIAIKPDDVITVPKAQLVYVIGAVNRSGGFPLTERGSMSVLQALALAEGLGRTASAKHARILSASNGSSQRMEREIDLRPIMEGKAADLPLAPNDILFIPNSAAKSASYRALEAVVQTGTGVAIYRPY